MTPDSDFDRMSDFGLVRYSISAFTFDGPAFDEGDEVTVHLVAVVARTEAGDRSLRVRDWKGPTQGAAR